MISDHKNYIVAAVGGWNRLIFDDRSVSMDGNWHFAASPEELEELLETLVPDYIFFPHWRWIVPDAYVHEYDCVCFHMTDLPYGRGGSPLQNLILAGHSDTMLTALKMDEGLDSGPIYLKRPLSLAGTAGQIYQRSSELCWDLMKIMTDTEIVPEPQVGTPTFFKRRKPEESELTEVMSDTELYDYIRMLDAPGYPKAYVRLGTKKIHFHNAKLENGHLTADVEIVAPE